MPSTIALLLHILSIPGLLSTVDSIISELNTHDPQSAKVTAIVANVGKLSDAVARSRYVQNGANGS